MHNRRTSAPAARKSSDDGNGAIPEVDWFEWHQVYTHPESRASRRLAAVQHVLHEALDELPPGPFGVISLCAGQGDDILGVLAGHDRRADARVTMVEVDPRNVRQALERALGADIPHVRGVAADAGNSDSLAGAPRASLVILAGMTAHISTADFARLIGWLPRICDTGAIVVWNQRSDLGTAWSIREARGAFRRAAFHDARLESPAKGRFRVFAHRFAGAPQPFEPGVRLFTFVASPLRPSLWRRCRRAAARGKRAAVRVIRST